MAENYDAMKRTALIAKTADANQPFFLRLEALNQGIAEPYDFVDDMPEPEKRAMMNASSVLRRVEAFPYNILIETPCSRLLAIASEAKRKFDEPVFPALDVVNLHAPAVIVSPGSNFLTAESIESTVIKRGGQILKPKASNLTTATVTNRAGNSREVMSGRFEYDFSTFDPRQPIVIILIGQSKNVTWPMTRQELGMLR